MKNKVKLMLLAFVMCILVVPSMTAKAAGEEVNQTAAGPNAANISWVSTYNADVDNYGVVVDGDIVATVPSTQNAYQITGLMSGSIHYVGIVGIVEGQPIGFLRGYYDKSGNVSYSNGIFIKVVTKPSKTSGLAYADNFGFNTAHNALAVQWKMSGTVDGYEVVLCNKSGKAIDTVDVRALTYKFYKTNAQNVYKVKVRGYLTMQNGTKVYGDYSDAFTAVPMPINATTKNNISRYAVTLKWKKVKGASEYIIYGSTKEKSGYKKIATVKSSKKSYKATKLKGKSINTVDRKYYFKIVAVAKVGKKKIKSQNNGHIGAHTTIRYVYR